MADIKNCEVIKQLCVCSKTVFNVWKMLQKAQTTALDPIPDRNRSVRTRRITESAKKKMKRTSRRRSKRKLTKELVIRKGSYNWAVEENLRLKPYKFQQHKLLSCASNKNSLAEERMCQRRCSVQQPLSSFSLTWRFSLWRLRSTTKTIGFTPLHEKIFPTAQEHISSDRKQLVSWFKLLSFLMFRNRPWHSLRDEWKGIAALPSKS